MSKQDLRSNAFKRAENNLVNKWSTAFSKNYPHHAMPGYNLNKSSCVETWNEEDVIGLFQEFPYSCDLPRPLLPPTRLPRTGINISCVRYIVQKYGFRKLCSLYIRCIWIALNKFIMLNCFVLNCLNFVVLGEEDPALQLLTLKTQLNDDTNRIMKHYNKHKKGLYRKIRVVPFFMIDYY